MTARGRRLYDAVRDAFAAPSTPRRSLSSRSGSPALCGPSRDDLYEYRPNRAVKEDTALGFALEGHESFLEDVADSLHAAAKRRRKLRRTMAKLKEAIGADPVVVPEGETQMAASRSTRTLADAMPAAVAQLTYTS
jgi:hypothetical protein